MGNLPRPRAPKPRRPIRPTLDTHFIEQEAQARGAAKLFNNQMPDLEADIYAPAKQQMDDVHNQAQQQGEPGEASTDYPGFPNYPIVHWEQNKKGLLEKHDATLGRTTLFRLLTDQLGPRRAEEKARNMAARNPQGRADQHDIFPAMHPGGADAHFDRPVYVLRQEGRPLLNASANPGFDILRVRKADDGNLTAARLHEPSHLAQDWGGAHMSRDVFRNLPRENSTTFWGSMLRDQGNFKGLNDETLAMLERAAEEYGFDFDLAQGEPGVIAQEDFVEALGSNSVGYPYKNFERRAITDSWKNLALQREGYETISDLPKGVNEMDFFRKALTEELTPFAPRGAVDGFNPDEYNWHQLRMRPFYEALTNQGKKFQDALIYAAGAGVPAAVGLSQSEREQ